MHLRHHIGQRKRLGLGLAGGKVGVRRHVAPVVARALVVAEFGPLAFRQGIFGMKGILARQLAGIFHVFARQVFGRIQRRAGHARMQHSKGLEAEFLGARPELGVGDNRRLAGGKVLGAGAVCQGGGADEHRQGENQGTEHKWETGISFEGVTVCLRRNAARHARHTAQAHEGQQAGITALTVPVTQPYRARGPKRPHGIGTGRMRATRRHRGLRKNTAQLVTLLARSNRWRMRSKLTVAHD